ncbi:hypothetical protein M0805_007939 [Coniferiporia weirii]|nr:hypothetical protein M0805_007939 [Coniferiporia weirii]
MPLPSQQELETFVVDTDIAAVYDYALTFEEERRLVWPSRFSLAKTAFVLNRYIPFFALPGLLYIFAFADPATSVDTCIRGARVFSFMDLAIYFNAECTLYTASLDCQADGAIVESAVILYLRAYAVWGGDRRVFAVLVLEYMGFLAGGANFAMRFIWDITSAGFVIPRSGCVPTYNGKLNWPACVALLLSETFVLLVLVLKTLQVRFSATLNQILADGVVYYLLILSTTLANIFVLRLVPSPLCDFLLSLQAVLHSVLCNRLLLRIRGAHYPIVSFAGPQSGLNFATPSMHGCTTITTESQQQDSLPD